MLIPFIYPDEKITDFLSFVRYIDYLTSGYLGIGILIIVGSISFLSTKSYTYERSLGFTSLIIFVSSIFLRMINLISNQVFYICIAILILSGILLVRERGTEEI